MSRSFLAAIRNAIFPPPEIAASIAEQPVSIGATVQGQPVAPAPSATATHPFSVQDTQGRFATIAKAPGIAGSVKRLSAALQLAAEAPEMSAEDIVAWTLVHVAVADVPARTIPSLEQRAADAQRLVDAIGTSPDENNDGWNMAIDQAMRLHKMN